MLRAFLGVSRGLPPGRVLSTSAVLSASKTVKKPGQEKSKSSVLSAVSSTGSQFKTYKPVTPGIRHLRRPVSPHLYEGPPIRLLTIPHRKKGGRNHQGRITVRHVGGGHKRRLRNVDFKREEPGPHDVVRIEYDPGRSAHIALIKARDANAKLPLSYILACEGLRAGDVVQSYRDGIPDGLVPGYTDPLWAKRRGSGPAPEHTPTASEIEAAPASEAESATTETASEPPSSLPPNPSVQAPAATSSTSVNPFLLTSDSGAPDSFAEAESAGNDASLTLSLGILRSITIKPGNVLPLRLIPTGTFVHALSLKPHGPQILVRSAGSFGQIVSHDDSGKYTQVKLQSGEVRNIPGTAVGTIGKVSNADWKNRSLGKAGRSRWLGIRPSVRGVAMNAVDHPHGGGRGKSKGNKQPRSIWGLLKGKRTRKPGPKGNPMVVRERPRGKEKRSN